MSARRELADYTNEGRLRTALERANPSMSYAAVDLCVEVVLRYCEPRRKSRAARAAARSK